MKTVLFLCPFFRDIREISQLGLDKKYNVIFDDYTSDWYWTSLHDGSLPFDQVIKAPEVLFEKYKNYYIDGVVASRDYPGSILASIFAQKFGLRSAKTECILRCEHKYISRLDQQSVVPDAVPSFYLIDKNSFSADQFVGSLPVFLKPVKASFSANAYCINSFKELDACISKALLPESNVKAFNYFLHKFNFEDYGNAQCLIAEGLLRGEQSTLECFVFEGKVYFLGIVDSIMYPNTFSFQRFEYPSSLPDYIQQKMMDIAEKLIKYIGFDNSLLNIEFMHDKEQDRVYIIEVNPRLCHQFADLFERVDGINTYEVMLDIAVGKKPFFSRGKGAFAKAGISVFRLFENKRVLKVPTKEELDRVHKTYPDARVEIFAHEGKKLGDQLQDSQSFRYGSIHLGGDNQADLLKRFEVCKEILTFKFSSV